MFTIRYIKGFDGDTLAEVKTLKEAITQLHLIAEETREQMDAKIIWDKDGRGFKALEEEDGETYMTDVFIERCRKDKLVKKLFKDSIWIAEEHRSIRRNVYRAIDGRAVILLDGELVEVRPDHTGFYSTKWES